MYIPILKEDDKPENPLKQWIVFKSNNASQMNSDVLVEF